MENSH